MPVVRAAADRPLRQSCCPLATPSAAVLPQGDATARDASEVILSRGLVFKGFSPPRGPVKRLASEMPC